MFFISCYERKSASTVFMATFTQNVLFWAILRSKLTGASLHLELVCKICAYVDGSLWWRELSWVTVVYCLDQIQVSSNIDLLVFWVWHLPTWLSLINFTNSFLSVYDEISVIYFDINATQGFVSGSVLDLYSRSGWIQIRIRILNTDPDPNPGVQKKHYFCEKVIEDLSNNQFCLTFFRDLRQQLLVQQFIAVKN